MANSRRPPGKEFRDGTLGRALDDVYAEIAAKTSTGGANVAKSSMNDIEAITYGLPPTDSIDASFCSGVFSNSAPHIFLYLQPSWIGASALLSANATIDADSTAVLTKVDELIALGELDASVKDSAFERIIEISNLHTNNSIDIDVSNPGISLNDGNAAGNVSILTGATNSLRFYAIYRPEAADDKFPGGIIPANFSLRKLF